MDIISSSYRSRSLCPRFAVSSRPDQKNIFTESFKVRIVTTVLTGYVGGVRSRSVRDKIRLTQSGVKIETRHTPPIIPTRESFSYPIFVSRHPGRIPPGASSIASCLSSTSAALPSQVSCAAQSGVCLSCQLVSINIRRVRLECSICACSLMLFLSRCLSFSASMRSGSIYQIHKLIRYLHRLGLTVLVNCPRTHPHPLPLSHRTCPRCLHHGPYRWDCACTRKRTQKSVFWAIT